MDTVGVREFREELATYVTRKKPFAVTRHGELLGYFIPVPHPDESAKAMEKLKKGAAEMASFLQSIGVTEDEIIAEVNELRRRDYELRQATDRNGRQHSDAGDSRTSSASGD